MSEKKRIFVVDDERMISETMQLILERSGYEARVFYDAESALTALDTNRPDLLVADINLTGMSGIELAAIVGARYPEVRFLMLSAQAGTSEMIQAVRSHGYEQIVLAKPIYPQELLSKISLLLE